MPSSPVSLSVGPLLSAAAVAPALCAVQLACKRGERRLFSGLDLRLAAGDLVWLRADNGRGKTSLLRLLAGLAAPEAGNVTLGDVAVRQATAAGVAPVYIGHANGLKDDLSASEALHYLARLHGAAADAPAVEAALQRLGLGRRATALVRTLSQGQRRRVALARLALELRRPSPRPWVLDEPYDALDDAGIALLNTLLGEHLARGGSAILTSHQALAASAPPACTLWLTATGLEARS
jgi:heme exporter protein A